VINISGPLETANPRERQNSNPNIYDDRLNNIEDTFQERKDDAEMRDTPEFRRYEEATNIELFYDLFFVANLTTFTDVHDINEVPALKAYAGFFCILWFLWIQVSLFDVRFVQDSILERIGKASQFGVMVGLAIVGPDFDPLNQVQSVFQSLAIILMLSRLILGTQYLTMLYLVWHYKDTKVPLALIAISNFIAAFVYFGTFL
jgi:low temperature requirement protein LtrA